MENDIDSDNRPIMIVNPDREKIQKLAAKSHLRLMACGMKGRVSLARIKEILQIKGRTAAECFANLQAKEIAEKV